MNRQQVYDQIKQTLGLVPSFFKSLPDNTLEVEWELFKRCQLEEGPIPNKYRELIGLGIAAVTRCKYCTFFHTEMAKVYGATPQEIEGAVETAKSSTGWSTYINGMQTDFEQFKQDVLKACEHARSKR
jgi:AhpD family alkylhydroperoxidase